MPTSEQSWLQCNAVDCSPIMKVQDCKRLEVCAVIPKYGYIFFFLAVFSVTFMGHYMKILKFQNKLNTIIMPRTFSVPPPANRHYNFCTFHPLSPEEALEEQLLLKSIAWPETPPLPSPLFLNNSSDPGHSTFTILPRRGGGQWHIGDKLEVLIRMYDFNGHPKMSGGDVFLTGLHNPRLGAGVAGQVVDHLNGSYTATFLLLWEGSAQVKVTLVHPSEAVTELRWINRQYPDRVYFRSFFRSGSVTEYAICNVCLRPTRRPVCNYTDVRTGEPWFCYKPKNLSCDDRINHHVSGYRQHLTDMGKLFQSGINMKASIPVSGPASVTILPKQEGQSEVNSSSVESGPSGFYYKGVWQALGGTKVQQFKTSSDITQCLKGKVIHMYGDSTVRQWFEYLNKALPGLKEFNLHSNKKNGPFITLDYENNILLTFRIHGPPLRSSPVPISELRYIANELDNVIGGSNTVVIFGIWAHFGSFPVEIYIQRLQRIRRAVVRLLSRSPETLVVIRTGNPMTVNPKNIFTNNDWYSMQRDKLLRAMFKGLNVHLVDAWEMVLAHHLPHNLHPQPPIIKNMISVILSYICPQQDG